MSPKWRRRFARVGSSLMVIALILLFPRVRAAGSGVLRARQARDFGFESAQHNPHRGSPVLRQLPTFHQHQCRNFRTS